MHVLLDTHAWVWSFANTDQLSPTAHETLQSAAVVRVSPISLFEIGQKVRIGKWPEMEPHIKNLPNFLEQQGGVVAELTPEVSVLAATLDWPHRDPFDRIIAATAILSGLTLLSADTMFDTLDDTRLHRIW